MPVRRFAAVVGVAVCAAAATAVPTSLGSSDDSAPLKIGIIAPSRSPAFNLPTSIAAAKAGVRALNARGGLHGHKIDLVYCNDKNDANQAQACARQLVGDKVIAAI